ncbi:hypothetical protein BD413DRAFT_524648 [Trametes elegans]|nr:hypothetical protein BD413DRAFT_524648 [Trametes elegans]
MDDDSYSSGSELTDLDEEEDVPLSQRNKSKSKSKASGDVSGYRIQGALKVPRATTYTCQSLYEQISAQDIDLQPEYQRDVVWPDNKQIGLIDSIFRNFYVPPVIFVVHTMDDGAERRVCVDGKQRLTSIYRFISGEIPHKDAFTGEKFVFRNDMGNSKAQILPERYRKLFLNKQIVCMEYQEITPENEREIFQRVQLGMALTPAERLQAVNSPLSRFIRELLDTYIVDGLANDIEWDTSRANDFRGIASAVYSMSRWPHLTTSPSLPAIEKWLHDPEDLDEDFKQDVMNTFQIFCNLAKDNKLRQCFWLSGIKKVAPVEVLSTCLLIHSFKRKMTMAQLSEAIGLMRQDIRKVEKDVRQNSRTMKQVLAFLKALKPSQLKAASGEPAASRHRAIKRKRVANESSSDEEKPPPSRPSQAKPTHLTPSQSNKPPTPQPPPPPPPPPPPVPPAVAPLPAVSPPTLRPPPAFNGSFGPTGAASSLSTSAAGSRVSISVPTAPAALRATMATQPSPSVNPRPTTALPPRPAVAVPPLQNSIGDNLMARMSTAPSQTPSTASRNGGVPSPSMPFHPGPNDYQSNRAYDPSRDPRGAAYHHDPRGYGGQPPGQYAKRY